ncbi:hypothetical protein PENSTE_c012G06583 [Penicillium steckii]|uniref:Hydrophobin n=1 Tax=Penicillium steckii TaxID=303698 RepID=A0A1V6T4Y0_9EURO|nr:hypothetical protein PENSTE_c012G06583 [Penicillium steckii]
MAKALSILLLSLGFSSSASSKASRTRPPSATITVVSTTAIATSLNEPEIQCASFFPWKPCPTGESCCNFFCVNTTSNALNCVLNPNLKLTVDSVSDKSLVAVQGPVLIWGRVFNIAARVMLQHAQEQIQPVAQVNARILLLQLHTAELARQTQPACCSGVCQDLGTSLQHCGACNAAPCSGVLPACCNGTCADLTGSVANCGICGLRLAAPAYALISTLISFTVELAMEHRASELFQRAALENVLILLLTLYTAEPATLLALV